jgi:hypothetical protein
VVARSLIDGFSMARGLSASLVASLLLIGAALTRRGRRLEIDVSPVTSIRTQGAVGMTRTASSSPNTLGAELERDRLNHRLGQLELVTATLRGRASQRRTGEAPVARIRVVGDLEAQVATTNARLSDLNRDPADRT